VTYEDIRKFFQGLPIKSDGVTICENREGRANGEAYVEFEDEASAYDAVREREGGAERDRERQRRERQTETDRQRERERDSFSVCVCVCTRARVRESVRVYIYSGVVSRVHESSTHAYECSTPLSCVGPGVLVLVCWSCFVGPGVLVLVCWSCFVGPGVLLVLVF
jgi:RNA recognition motif-containing protein